MNNIKLGIRFREGFINGGVLKFRAFFSKFIFSCDFGVKLYEF